MSTAIKHLHLVADDPAPEPGGDRFLAGYRQPARPRKPLGQILLEMQAVEPGNMLKALALRQREEAQLGDILMTHGWVSEGDLMAAFGRQWQTRTIDLAAEPPDPRLLDRLGPDFCLRSAILPWRRIGGATVLVTARPDGFAAMRAGLPDGFGTVVMALASERDIHAALIAARRTALIRQAETRVAAAESCRGQDGRASRRLGLSALAVIFAGTVVAPLAVFGLFLFWAVLTLISGTGLKLACFLSELRATRRGEDATPPRPLTRLPVVSVMIPLFREDDIAPRLIRRLGRIDYPKELLDILLVAEADDHATLAALAGRSLPRWMRVVTVPEGPIRTKPRALNYALNFCRGSIIGVWDAEDAPEPQQIRKIVRRFAEAADDVACLQGVLDYYNSRHNWLTRCFTIEYAAWFRAMLPGLARLGFVVPLGGTTLFFRRTVLEELGGWDAHNVTEDADLGLRLARRGYRTELVRTVTEEEPNAHALTWIRQRSRWQKGYAVTWATHMRAPGRLWRDLGAKRFWGVQILFIGSLSQSILAPVLWSFWLIAFGLPHPMTGILPGPALAALALMFVLSEAVTIAVGLWATRGPAHRHLQKWVPTLHLYFPLGALSSYKALYEWIMRPFFWDKTAHGVVAARSDPADLLPVLVLSDPVHVPVGEVLLLPLRAPHPTAPRLHLLPVSDTPGTPPVSGRTAVPVEAAPPRRRRSALAAAGSGVELQPRFERLGDM